ncbi:uncharacterized protein LOC105835584 [Monomorium pharaonis]|uniref:uncharacterized protein LOC105835584 n=1 Tax=Monomorium pharaonis TaxID=307658 RepID=UPI00063F2418|nr:uncharacterized protein LOC105835584 [Monomorium pharaonis]
MNTKLAIKHKDSLVLKENKPLEKKCVSHKQGKRWELLLPWITFGVFLVYWFVLCPIIWTMGELFERGHKFVIFWTVAFIIWIVIMCVLLIFWRRFLNRQSLEINALSKYGSDNVERPVCVQQLSSEDTEFLELKKRDDSKSKKSERENFKQDLPPLVIHKQIFGENIEDTTGVVRVEEDEKTHLSNDYAEKSPLQDYLKLVMVSPSEDEMKSPSMKSPMSPRELFFIDLIREADRAESANMRSLKTRSHSFPREATENDIKRKTYFFPSEAIVNDSADVVKGEKNEKDAEDLERRKNIRDTEDTQDEKDNNKSKRESSYFIADVETTEKTEVFLRIEPNVDEETGLTVEKSGLILQSNEPNSQERN